VEQNAQVVEEAGRVLRERLALFDAQLSNQEWVVGQFSLADITLLVGIEFATASQFAVDPSWTSLSRWHEAMKQRPSAKA
jgi:glutathione S-transferase